VSVPYRLPATRPSAQVRLEEESVPLSEHEQRLLEQLERALQDEDPKFASALQGSRLRGRLRLRLLSAVVGVLLGLAAVGYGVASHRVALEVAGALVAAGCAWLAWTAWRRMPAPGEIVPATKLRQLRRARNRSAKTQGTFMQRMELRWQHRRERDQF
jgi:hypothetical protein